MRKNPVAVDMPKVDKHEEMIEEMHGALYTLGDCIRKPYPSRGEKLLPAKIRSAETPKAKVARKHVEHLMQVFKKSK